MTVKEFLMNYEKTHDIEKHVIKKYIPYAKKVSMCDRIVRSTSYETIADKQVFKINTPARQELFLLNMVDLYTDIDINWENSLSDFDVLSEKELLGAIIKAIPESEITLFSSILEMCLDDLMTNTRDLVSYIDGKLTAVEVLANSALEMLQSNEGKAVIESIANAVSK